MNITIEKISYKLAYYLINLLHEMGIWEIEKELTVPEIIKKYELPLKLQKEIGAQTINMY